MSKLVLIASALVSLFSFLLSITAPIRNDNTGAYWFICAIAVGVNGIVIAGLLWAVDYGISLLRLIAIAVVQPRAIKDAVDIPEDKVT